MRKIEDLLLDPLLIKWAKKPTKELDDYWEQWIKKHPESEMDLAIAKEMAMRLKHMERIPSKYEIERNFTQLNAQLEKGNNNHNKPKMAYGKVSSFNYLMKIAAVILVLILSVWVVYQVKHSDEMNAIQNQEIALIIKTNPSVVKSQIRLPDGSRVWLNSNSSISYPEIFGEVRIVEMTGEAYFEVVENRHVPFVVKTNYSEIKVLGTSFNVNTFNDNTTEMISLINGKVEVKSIVANDATILVPGQQILIDLEKEQHHISSFDATEVVGWKDGWLVFRNANLKQIIGKLERWYGVEIKLLNKPNEDWDVNGHFQDQPLEVVLNRLSFSKDFEYTIDNKTITIKF